MANTQAPKGTKAGTKVTFSDGSTGYVTQGGQYRIDSGPNKGKLWAGAVPGATGGGTPGAPADVPQTTENTTPSNFSPSGGAYLQSLKSNLQNQVAQGLINQAQADAEYNRRVGMVNAANPAVQDVMWNVQNQVAQGLINQSQADNEIYRQQGLQNQTQPNTNVSLTDKSSTAAVENQIRDSAKGSAIAGNLLTNPNQVNPFGQSQVTIDPVTGQPTVSQTLSQANQNVLGGIQGGAVQAGGALQGLLGGGVLGSINGAGDGGPNSNLSNAIYKQLTQYTNQNFDKERNDLEQRLVQSGNPVGSPRYRAEMDQLNQRYDSLRQNAGNQAVTGSINAATSLLPTLSGVQQSGFYQPNFQGFNAVQYQQPDVQGLYNTQYAGQLTREGYDAQIKQQQIAANATKSAAEIAAEASKANAETVSNANKPGAFSTRPPGS